MLGKLWESLKNDGPITFLIKFFCICILYVFFYWFYTVYKFFRFFLFLMPGSGPAYPTYVILGIIAYALYFICILIIPSLGTLFVVLYIIYKVVQKMGFGFILDGISLFKECWDTGLFGLFDDIAGILGANEYLFKKFGMTFEAVFKFLKTFLKNSFGIVFDGYELDDQYLDAALEIFLNTKVYKDKQMCEMRKKEITSVIDKKQPIIKIKFNENVPVEDAAKNMSQMDVIKMNNCIKANTVEIPQDANTIERLQIIFQNELAKNTCYARCQIGNVENTVQNIGDNIAQMTKQNWETLSSGFTHQSDKNTADMEKVKKDNKK